jgi:hypothetical protein
VEKITQEELSQTPITRLNAFLDSWIIMPNYLYIIIEINNQLSDDIPTLGRDTLQCRNVLVIHFCYERDKIKK